VLLMKSLLGWLVASLAPLALAHEGHGLPSSHWHTTDAWGFVALGLIVAVALWAGRRK
jgi:hypothetical protein